MWFSTLQTQKSSRRALLSSVLALASFQQVYARSQPQDIEEPGTVKQWEGLNLSLKTAWNAGPYILEILECAGLEKPAFYFTLLDLIKSGTIKIVDSDKEMYESVVAHVEKNELLDHRFLPTWKFCISLRETAPRVEAQYQYYSNSVDFPKGKSCPVWFDDGETKSCNPQDLSKVKPESGAAVKTIAFDRFNTEDTRKGLVTLYIDIIEKEFPKAYTEMTKAADEAGIAYRIRYKPSPSLKNPKPVGLSGYGVGLSLKKTDYLVIDDRDAKEGGSAVSDASSSTESSAKPSPTYKFRAPENLKPGEKRFPLWDLVDVDDPVRDLRDLLPLSHANVGDIGFKTANFVTKSGIFPPDMLMKILSDFPKYAHTIGTMGGVLNEWVEEHSDNREIFVPAGYNIMFLNGMALDPSEVTASNLIGIMRRERHHGLQIRQLGLNQQETLDLIIHENITDARLAPNPPRFDYREQEGESGAIIWLNDLEKDERYSTWPDSIEEVMTPQYGGQLAAISKKIHTVVIPLDFSNRDDLKLITEKLHLMIVRELALTIGIVPVVRNNLGSANSRIFRALLESYDLETAVSYIRDGLQADKHGVRYPAPEYVQHATKGRTRRDGSPEVSLSAVMESKEFQRRAQAAGHWEARFGVIDRPYPFLVNGIVDFFGDDWIRTLSSAFPKDVKRMQDAVEKGILNDNADIQDFILDSPLPKRNIAIFPADEKVALINIADLFDSNPEIFDKLPHFPGKLVEEKETLSADVWVIGDFDTESGYNLLAAASKFQDSTPGISITAISNPGDKTGLPTLSALLHSLAGRPEVLGNPGILQKIIEEIKPEKDFVDLKIDGQKVFGEDAKTSGWALPDKVAAEKFWSDASPVIERKFKLKPGERAILVNGRFLGPFDKDAVWTVEDMDTLVQVELKTRITPILNAAKNLKVLPRLRAANYKARLTSTVTSLLEGENTSLANGNMPVRTNKYMEWKRGKTVLTAGDPMWSTFRFFVSLDPVSEVGQKWAPILRVLMSMDGVGIYTFLNPSDNLREVPIKRYYRHVLSSQPKFDQNGDILDPKAQFIGLPDKTLYSLSMDVPPSWLVTPSETIHDLDNIKLQTFKERFGTSDLNATYVLKNILIEGHSRDTTRNEPSSGAQLELGTPQNPVMQDTIVMSNLGYFQLKSNPGHWQIRLKPGRSSDVFSIQSLGTTGFTAINNAEDDVQDITLMSLNGVTLFPRLKRNKGYNSVNVLAPLDSADNAADKAAGFAEGLLSKFGFGKKKENGVTKAPAEINIFSVASGHLYERFLNIMMVSVMRHTKHTVKFWFIENFLSPAFKDFLPVMAKEYNFDYELVTYKWPHWLRDQKEKQREIWGYKILFLDVLFPLNLDKIIFVDADQIVRTDLKELVDLDLGGAVYGFTPMCDSRTEIEGYRFWKQGYWKQMLGDLKYHISALFVVDLKIFRQLAAGDRLRQQYHQLSADPNSLSNLDQDLPNNMQRQLPIFSLPQDWLWCETWCSDESFKTAKTIDLCNNPMTKEPKLDRARRQIPEWTEYDDEVAALAKKVQAKGVENMREALVQKEALGEQEKATKEEKKEDKAAESEKPKDEL
ncbi:hypothetical protein TWF730_003609 [Orbilia blumenaviensis]|uniref:UDP-glucose:glycoprotein glucosyltransferase n=1 Tax=Orbilia blumenaviensis TaxID=1796055 RepID=A0AAV9U2X7_9PEZI